MTTETAPLRGVLDPREQAAARAERFNLTPTGKRPALATYVTEVWHKRSFIGAFATANLLSSYSKARLGQVWQVLTPILNVAVYWFVFGALLHTNRGIPNFLAFLVVGVFIFNFTQTAVLTGTRAISDRLDLIRALHFPRACLPIAFTVVQFQQLIISTVIMLVVIVATGVMPTWHWILIIPLLACQFIFNAGLSLAVARIGARVTDVSQLMPFITRTWLYCSGLFYSIHSITKQHAAWIALPLEYNPAALFIDLSRTLLGVSDGTPTHHAWLALAGWSVAVGIGGFIFFWRAEEQYGRG